MGHDVKAGFRVYATFVPTAPLPSRLVLCVSTRLQADADDVVDLVGGGGVADLEGLVGDRFVHRPLLLEDPLEARTMCRGRMLWKLT